MVLTIGFLAVESGASQWEPRGTGKPGELTTSSSFFTVEEVLDKYESRIDDCPQKIALTPYNVGNLRLCLFREKLYREFVFGGRCTANGTIRKSHSMIVMTLIWFTQ